MNWHSLHRRGPRQRGRKGCQRWTQGRSDFTRGREQLQAFAKMCKGPTAPQMCLPIDLLFVPESRTQAGPKFTLPAKFTIGVPAAVVVSPVNSQERVPPAYGLVFLTGSQATVKELQGRPDVIEKYLT